MWVSKDVDCATVSSTRFCAHSMKRTLSGWLTTLLVALDGCCLATTEEHHIVTSTPMSATTEPLTNVSRDASPKKQLHLLGLFGKEGDYPVGWAFQFASEMAVNDINKRADMLPGYTLVLDSIDTKVSFASRWQHCTMTLCCMVSRLVSTCDLPTAERL